MAAAPRSGVSVCVCVGGYVWVCGCAHVRVHACVRVGVNALPPFDHCAHALRLAAGMLEWQVPGGLAH